MCQRAHFVTVTDESEFTATALAVDLPSLCSGVRPRHRCRGAWFFVEHRPIGERRRATGCVLRGGGPCLCDLCFGIANLDHVGVGLPSQQRA
jgi:hypothetical protein